MSFESAGQVVFSPIMAESNDHGSPVINGGLTVDSDIPTVIVSESTSPNDVKSNKDVDHRPSESQKDGGVYAFEIFND